MEPEYLFLIGYTVGVVMGVVCTALFFARGYRRERQRADDMAAAFYRERHRGMPATAPAEEEEWPEIVGG